MTQTQRNAIGSPATGLLIYQNDHTPGFYYYNGTAWAAVTQKSKGWSLTGNSGTNPSTNFIGTTDAQPLSFKVNNTKAGHLDYDYFYANTSLGMLTLDSITTGFNNTAFGFQSLVYNTTGSDNVAIGADVLVANKTGSDNTGVGASALWENNGSGNTAIGAESMGSY